MPQLRTSDITKKGHGVIDHDELDPPDSQALEDQYVKQIAETLRSAVNAPDLSSTRVLS